MEIKSIHRPSGLPALIRRFFNTRRRIITGVLAAGGVMAFIILCFGVLGLGAYQNRIAQDHYYEPALYKIAHLDLSPLHKAIRGNLSTFEQLKIDIAPEHLDQIRQMQEKAFETGGYTAAAKPVSFPATINYLGRAHQLEIGPAEGQTWSFTDGEQLSFQLRAGATDIVAGMPRFRLWAPSTGVFIKNWLTMALLRERGVRSLNGDFVRLSVNGASAGIFYLEEQFDEALYRQHRFGPGVLFKVEKGELICGPGEQAQQAAKQQLKQKWQDLQSGNLDAASFFDLEQLGRFFAHIDLMNQENPFQSGSACFYLNPETGLAEPIAAGFRDLTDTHPFPAPLFIEPAAENGEKQLWFNKEPLLQLIANQLDFKRAYLREAEWISQDSYIAHLLAGNGDRLHHLLTKVYPDLPMEESPVTTLYAKAKIMRYILSPDVEEVSAYLDQKTATALQLSLQNHQDLPIEVSSVSWRDSIFFYPTTAILLSRNTAGDEHHQPFEFNIPDHVSWADSLIPELEVNYSVAGLQNGQKSVLVFPWPLENSRDHAGNPIAGNPNYHKFDFIEERENGDLLNIPAGNWSLSSDLIIPGNKRLQIAAGAEIDLLNHARIVSYSPIFLQGSEQKPVTVKSSDSTGEGLLVIKAGLGSELTYTNFDQLSCPREEGWGLSGAVTFYESPVTIRSCNFSSNLVGDDFLNIVRAGFTMDQVTFRNIKADAFDCDFCKGTVTNSSFINVGNDGIDVSGSQLEVRQVYMEFIGDKGLSAGEKSEMTASWIEIKNAEIAVASKDGSALYLSDAKLVEAKIGLTLFEKKSEYGPAFMTADRVNILHAEIPYLVEERSSLSIDGSLFITNQEHVRGKLYGVEYGKSSK